MMRIQEFRSRASAAISYRLRDFASGAMAHHCRPSSIILMLTERCNARCLHCDIWKNKGGEATPTVSHWKRLLSDLASWLGPAHIALSGGEALLRPYTPELIAWGKRRGLLMELLTHGYWLDQSRIESAALADPWRITVSVDGIGDIHNLVRGRQDFWTHTERSIRTLIRLRSEKNLRCVIRLKTVVMRQNLDHVLEVARFAAENGLEVFYQPIEQNYNTPDDPNWYLTGNNWPVDIDAAIRQVDRLIEGWKSGLPIRNSLRQLEVMKDYFSDPGHLVTAVQGHTAHENRPVCSAATGFQIQANGDVVICSHQPPVGNIGERRIRDIWVTRPRYWIEGCCQHRQTALKPEPGLTVIS
jgi:MoaA/NifB/PqqE/SkfB family radical SAM enzyme